MKWGHNTEPYTIVPSRSKHERIMIDLLPINHHFWQPHFIFSALHYFLSKGKGDVLQYILVCLPFFSNSFFSAFIMIPLRMRWRNIKRRVKRNYNAIKIKFGCFWMIFTVIILRRTNVMSHTMKTIYIRSSVLFFVHIC